MASKPAAGERSVSTYCYQCVAGPDLLKVRIEDGIATEVSPNFDAAAIHPAGGKVCVKAFGLVQKAYTPNRVLTPMKRTNPKKGRHEDPGFVAISWRTSSKRRAAAAWSTSRVIRALPQASAAAERRPPTWARCPPSWVPGGRST